MSLCIHVYIELCVAVIYVCNMHTHAYGYVWCVLVWGCTCACVCSHLCSHRTRGWYLVSSSITLYYWLRQILSLNQKLRAYSSLDGQQVLGILLSLSMLGLKFCASMSRLSGCWLMNSVLMLAELVFYHLSHLYIPFLFPFSQFLLVCIVISDTPVRTDMAQNVLCALNLKRIRIHICFRNLL